MKATRKEIQDGGEWEVLGVVIGFRGKEEDAWRRALSLEHAIKRGAKAFSTGEKFQGGWLDHRTRVLEMIQQAENGQVGGAWKGEEGRLGPVGKVWGRYLEVWWWRGLVLRPGEADNRERWLEAWGEWTEEGWQVLVEKDPGLRLTGARASASA